MNMKATAFKDDHFMVSTHHVCLLNLPAEKEDEELFIVFKTNGCQGKYEKSM